MFNKLMANLINLIPFTQSPTNTIDNTNQRKITKWVDFFPKGSKLEWLGQVFSTVEILLYVIMGLVGVAGAIYAIYLGIQLAKAEDQGKRDEAKKHLITVLIAVAVTIVFVLFFNLLLPVIIGAFVGKGITTDNTPIKPSTLVQPLQFILKI